MWEDILGGWGPEGWLLACAAVSALSWLLWKLWPRFSGTFPRLSALLWPHLPVGVLLLGIIALLFVVLVSATGFLWGDPSMRWEVLAPGMKLFDWIWPWLPTLLVFFGLLSVVACTLSRRVFHGVALATLAAIVLGVLLHGGVPAPARASSVLLREEAPPRPPYTAFDWWMAPPESAEPPTIPEVAGERLARRVLAPIFHHEDVQPDFLTAAAFGVVLLFGFSLVDRLNLRRSLQPIRVASIEGGRDAEGKPLPRPDLEHLMRECLHRHAPHTPPPVPGGALGYWQDFVEQQSVKDTHWLTRAAAVVIRLIRPPAGLEISGSLIPVGEGVKGESGHHGIRIHMMDLRTRQTLLARTFRNAISVEQAIEQAAHSAVERAIEQCRALPEWIYWEDGDGTALGNYHQGVFWLSQGAGERENARKAREHLEAAARRSPGSAMVRLQLAEALEACGDYVGALEIYLQVCARYPRLLVARFRLASVCRSAPDWVARLDEAPRQSDSPRRRLREALDCELARELRRPTHLSRLIEWSVRRRACPRARPPSFFRRRPIEFEECDTERLRDALLNMAVRALRQLRTAGAWSVLAWCALSTADRRFFWHTLLWPPQRRRDVQLSLRVARRCVEWRQLHRLAELYRQERGGTSSPLLHRGRRPSHLLLRLRMRRCQHAMERASRRAARAVRIRPNWLGGAHYHLACFYAVCLDAELRQFPHLYTPGEDVGRVPEPRTRMAENPLVQEALRAFKETHADFATVRSGIEQAYRESRENSIPADFDIDSSNRNVRSEREWEIRALSKLMERVDEAGRLLPAHTRRRCWRVARHRRALEHLGRQEWRALRRTSGTVRRKAATLGKRMGGSTSPESPSELAALRERLSELDPYLEFIQWTGRRFPRGDIADRVPPEYWVDLADRMTALLDEAGTLLGTHAAAIPGSQAARKKLRASIQKLSTALLCWGDVVRLATKLQHLEENIVALQRLCAHARFTLHLSRRSCNHLSHSMRDREGPFSLGTKEWLLQYPDLEALRPQRSFESWRHVTLRQQP